MATFPSDKCFGLVDTSRVLEENKAVGESVEFPCIIIPTIHGTSLCCLRVVQTCLYEVHCKAVSEGLLGMARRFKANCCNAVLDIMRCVTIF